VIKKGYHTIFKWLRVLTTGREQFSEAIAVKWEYDQLYQYKISFEEILDQAIKELRFTRLETDSKSAKKKESDILNRTFL
jgi:hypothetical protein